MIKWYLWFSVALISFLITEFYSVLAKVPTLSRTVWRLTKAYPIFPFLFGAVVGGLAIHFFGWLPACVP